jgi:hypothetical protein
MLICEVFQENAQVPVNIIWTRGGPILYKWLGFSDGVGKQAFDRQQKKNSLFFNWAK